MTEGMSALKLALDSGVLTYFLQANPVCGYDPALDPDRFLAPQRVAAFRLYIYGENFFTVPTVREEASRISDPLKRREHVKWIAFHFEEVTAIDVKVRDARVAEFQQYHSGRQNEDDCRIVAECEQGEIDALVSFDTKNPRLSAPRSRPFIGSSEECWKRLQILRGATPRHPLMPDHPSANATWWRWRGGTVRSGRAVTVIRQTSRPRGLASWRLVSTIERTHYPRTTLSKAIKEPRWMRFGRIFGWPFAGSGKLRSWRSSVWRPASGAARSSSA